MRTSDFPIIKEAQAAAHSHLEFYREMSGRLPVLPSHSIQGLPNMSNLIETANRLERMHPDWSRERCLGEAVRVAARGAAASTAPAVPVPPLLTDDQIASVLETSAHEVGASRAIEAAVRAQFAHYPGDGPPLLTEAAIEVEMMRVYGETDHWRSRLEFARAAKGTKMDEQDTYVMSDEEVKLTGRTAIRPGGLKQQEVVEITPVDSEQGTWKKWVPLASLFKVQK